MDDKPGTRPRKTPRTQDRPQGSKEAQGTASPPKTPKQAKNPKEHPKHQKAPRVAALGFASATREKEGEPKQRANNMFLLSLEPLAFVIGTLKVFWSWKSSILCLRKIL